MMSKFFIERPVLANVRAILFVPIGGVSLFNLPVAQCPHADGSYTLTVTFQIGTDPDLAQVLVQNRVTAAMAALPQPVQAQGVLVRKKSTAILQIVALASPTGQCDGLFMRNYASINLVNELARVPGVGNVNVFGAGAYSMRVWMDPQKMQSFGLVPSDVIRAIKQQNQNVAAGQPACRRHPTRRISSIQSISSPS